MYVKKIELANFQVIKEFAAEFTGNVYFISGENELGKSTLLKAIAVLLTGQRDEVLRIGEKKGFAKMIVGDAGKEYEVSLSFTEANPRGTLTIKCDGVQSNRISMLQELFGYQDFDAVEFLRWGDSAEGRRKQVAVVKSLFPKKVAEELERCEKALADAEQRRLELGREVKAYKTIADEAEKGLPERWEEYGEPKDLTELMKQQQAAALLIEKAKTVRTTLKQRITTLESMPERRERIKKIFEAEQAKAKMILEAAQKEYDRAWAEADALEAETKTRKTNCEEWLAKYEAHNPEEIDFGAEIARISAYNESVGKIAQYKEKRAKFEALNAEWEECQRTIAKTREEKAAIVQSARLPITGLEFSEDGLSLNGVPFVAGKISDSQAMEVAAKLVIAANPKVKVFRIARGESLGTARLKALVAIAKKYGYQGFIEQVQRGQNEMTIEEYTEG